MVNVILDKDWKKTAVTYGVTVAVVIVAAIARTILAPLLMDGAPFSTFIIAVIFCTWYYGLRSAALATVLGFIVALVLFIQPPLAEFLTLPALSRYGMFFVICSSIATFGEATRIAQGQLKESERLAQSKAETLRITLASIGDAVITTDGNGLVTYLNAVAENLIGWRNASACGKPLRDMFQVIDEKTRLPIENPVIRVLRDQQIVALANHTLLVRSDGSERPIDDTAAPILDEGGHLRGVILVFRDLTERKLAELEIQRGNQASEQQRRIYETALSNTADFNYVFDLQGRFVYANEPLLHLWRKDLLEVVGKNYFDLGYPAEMAERLQRQIQTVIETRQPLRAESSYASAGDERQYEYILVPVLEAGGRLEAVTGSTRDITDRKLVEIALQESEQRFRQLADAMPQIVWTARPDGYIDYQNRQWQEFTGLPESLGNDGWSQILHFDDAQPARDRWAASVKTGALFDMELRLFDRRANAYRWHLIRTIAIRDAAGNISRWFGTSTDIHEQKCASEASRYLAEASAVLSGVEDYESTLQKVVHLSVPYFADWAAVDIANDAGTLRRLAVADRDPDKVLLSHALVEHYPHDGQMVAPIAAVFRSVTPEVVTNVTDEMLVKLAKDEQHLQMLRSLGIRSYLCVPLVSATHSLGVITFATAESGRRYTEADLAFAKDLAHRAAVAIENTRLYQALREADRRKDEFLATLAHELRNPLAPIRNSLQILKLSQVDPTTMREIIDMMERQVHQLVRLVDDLLDVSRVMRGKIELRKEPVELATIVSRAVETAQPLIDSQDHQLEISLPTESLLLDADPVRLSQVIGNLLTNAAKYTEANGQIWLTAGRDNGEAILRVRDNGIGIAPEMMPEVFGLFVQADHSSTRSQGGLGIGLTLVKSLVEMHGGRVEGHSPGLGKGAEFTVRIPLLQSTRSLGEPIDQKSDSEPLPGHRLMVVDDNKDAAISLAMLLRIKGYDVRVAHDGLSALKLAATYLPEIVFLDIGMPGMDGYEVARSLRQIPELQQTVLAALTGWGQQEDRRRTADAGFDHHLVKPPDPKALDEVLTSLLAK